MTWIWSHEAVSDHEERLQRSRVFVVLDGLERPGLCALSTGVVLLATFPTRAIGEGDGRLRTLPIGVSTAAVGASPCWSISCCSGRAPWSGISSGASIPSTAGAATSAVELALPLHDGGCRLARVRRGERCHELGVLVGVRGHGLLHKKLGLH